jgi:hypothetical protein
MVRYRNLSNRVDAEQEIEVGLRLERHIESFFQRSSQGRRVRSPTGHQYQEVLSLNRTSEQLGGPRPVGDL